MASSVYDDNTLPTEGIPGDALPSKYFDDIKTNIDDIMSCGGVIFCEAKAAYIYERKVFAEYDVIPGERNTAYGSGLDDIVIQLSFRLDGAHLRNNPTSISAIINQINDEHKAEKVREAQEKVDKAKQAYEAALANLEGMK